MPTPHNSAAPGDYAPAVLMPGDPRRARRIAETLFDDARLVNEVRGMEAYTGTVGGRPISVMGSGMGMPTMTIYATELYREYGVRRIVRVGTSGGFQDDLSLGDVIVATAAHTDSAINAPRIPGVTFAPAASYPLLRAAVDAADRAGTPVRVGPVFSSDHFYLARPGLHEGLRDHGVLGVDMETAALYAVAAAEGGEALTVLTVSDHLFREEAMPSEDREKSFAAAAHIALEAAFS
ncbi:purine-nucleoside phosphorylase [Tsukamurella paurometabola]|uniref:Uridine phosphorylase n=1 Tax=Tsukamurella paurometabola TaxID=2061 RepID=A0ABS5NF96_TSUPA|nr:purine-nucleoside phosphorylase [Tsukamurella paurometabola]MBS4102537.1 purine-nucleoside phosphorylase [Tsukamurella paurometabola]